MPLYEYQCPKCGNKFEILRGITQSTDDVKCPRCGAEKPEKLVSSVCCGGGKSGLNKGNLRIPT